MKRSQGWQSHTGRWGQKITIRQQGKLVGSYWRSNGRYRWSVSDINNPNLSQSGWAETMHQAESLSNSALRHYQPEQAASGCGGGIVLVGIIVIAVLAALMYFGAF